MIDRLPRALPNLRSLGLSGETAVAVDTSRLEEMPTFVNVRIKGPAAP